MLKDGRKLTFGKPQTCGPAAKRPLSEAHNLRRSRGRKNRCDCLSVDAQRIISLLAAAHDRYLAIERPKLLNGPPDEFVFLKEVRFFEHPSIFSLFDKRRKSRHHREKDARRHPNNFVGLFVTANWTSPYRLIAGSTSFVESMAIPTFVFFP